MSENIERLKSHVWLVTLAVLFHLVIHFRLQGKNDALVERVQALERMVAAAKAEPK